MKWETMTLALFGFLRTFYDLTLYILQFSIVLFTIEHCTSKNSTLYCSPVLYVVGIRRGQTDFVYCRGERSGIVIFESPFVFLSPQTTGLRLDIVKRRMLKKLNNTKFNVK